MFGGWVSFLLSICGIGVLTAVIGDVASHFGCYSGMRDQVTAITIVALGTSVPGGSNPGARNAKNFIFLLQGVKIKMCTIWMQE